MKWVKKKNKEGALYGINRESVFRLCMTILFFSGGSATRGFKRKGC